MADPSAKPSGLLTEAEIEAIPPMSPEEMRESAQRDFPDTPLSELGLEQTMPMGSALEAFGASGAPTDPIDVSMPAQEALDAFGATGGLTAPAGYDPYGDKFTRKIEGDSTLAYPKHTRYAPLDSELEKRFPQVEPPQTPEAFGGFEASMPLPDDLQSMAPPEDLKPLDAVDLPEPEPYVGADLGQLQRLADQFTQMGHAIPSDLSAAIHKASKGEALIPASYPTIGATETDREFISPSRQDILNLTPDTPEQIKTSVIDDYVESIMQESNAHLYKRPQNDRYRKESKARLRGTAEAIYRANMLKTGKSEPLMDIYDRLENEKDTGLHDPHTPFPREYGAAVIHEELLSSGLPAEIKSRVLDSFFKRMDEEQPDVIEMKRVGLVDMPKIKPEGVAKRLKDTPWSKAIHFDTSRLPYDHSWKGDMTKILGGASNVFTTPLALLVGGGQALYTEDKYAVGKGTKPKNNLEIYAKHHMDAINLVQWHKSGQEVEVSPGAQVAELLQGKRPHNTEPNFKSAVRVSLAGEQIGHVARWSPADVIKITSHIARDSDEIKSRIKEIEVSRWAEENRSKIGTVQSVPSPAFQNYARENQLLRDFTEEDIEAYRNSEELEKLVNSKFNRYLAANFFDEDTVDALPSSDQRIVEIFSEYFPAETYNSQAADTVNAAAEAVFDQSILDELLPPGAVDSDVMALVDVDENYAALRELLLAVPESERENAKRILLGDRRLHLIRGSFSGELHDILKGQRAMFQKVAIRFLQQTEHDRVVEAAKQGLLGKEWEGSQTRIYSAAGDGFRSLTSDELERLHQSAPVLFELEQMALTPEFQTATEQYFSELGAGLATYPHEMWLSLVAIHNNVAPQTGFLDKYFEWPKKLRRIGSPEDQEKAQQKLEDDPFLVYADATMALSLFGWLYKAKLSNFDPRINVVFEDIHYRSGTKPSSAARRPKRLEGPQKHRVDGPESIEQVVDAYIEVKGINVETPATIVKKVANAKVDPADVVVHETTYNKATGAYEVASPTKPRLNVRHTAPEVIRPTNTTIVGEVVVSPYHSYVGYIRELQRIRQDLEKLDPTDKATKANLLKQRAATWRLLEASRTFHEEARTLETTADQISPSTGKIETIKGEAVFGDPKQAQQIKDEYQAKGYADKAFAEHDELARIDNIKTNVERQLEAFESQGQRVTTTTEVIVPDPGSFKLIVDEVVADWREAGGLPVLPKTSVSVSRKDYKKPALKSSEKILRQLRRIAKDAGIEGKVFRKRKEVIYRDDIEGAPPVGEVAYIDHLTTDQFLTVRNHMIKEGIDNVGLWVTLYENSTLPVPKKSPTQQRLALEHSEVGSEVSRGMSEFEEMARDHDAAMRGFEGDIGGEGLPPDAAPTYGRTLWDDTAPDEIRLVEEAMGPEKSEVPPGMSEFEEMARDHDASMQKFGERDQRFIEEEAYFRAPVWGGELRKAFDTVAYDPNGPRYQLEVASDIIKAKESQKITRIKTERIHPATKEHIEKVQKAEATLNYLSSNESGYRVGNTTTPGGLSRMVKALKAQGVDDPVVWRVLFDRADIGHVSNATVAQYVAEVQNKKFESGVKARQSIIESIDSQKGPMQVLSEETRQNPRVVDRKLDSLAIAQELSKSPGGENPINYLGLNLTPLEISGFVNDARTNKKKAVIVKKTYDDANNRRFDESMFFEPITEGSMTGIRVGLDPETYSLLPDKIKGMSMDTLGQRARRVAERLTLGDKGHNFMNMARETGSFEFTKLAAAEFATQPGGILNLPMGFRLAMSELTLHAWANNWTGPASDMARRFFEGLAKPTLTLGDDLYHLIKQSEGNFNLEVKQLAQEFGASLDEFIVTDAKVKALLGETTKFSEKDIVFDKLDVHQIGHIIHRNIEDVYIVDKTTGKSYVLPEVVEPVVQARRLMKRTAMLLDAKLQYLEGVQAKAVEDFASGTKAPNRALSVSQFVEERIDAISRWKGQLEARLESKKTHVKTNEVFPNIRVLKEQQKNAKDPLKARLLQDRIDVYDTFTPAVIRDSVTGLEYRLKKPVAQMDDFEKALAVFAEHAVKPRANKMFDLISQLVIAQDNTRLMFESGKGIQHIVAQKKIIPGTDRVRYEVVREFPATQEGQSQATALAREMSPLAPETLSETYQGAPPTETGQLIEGAPSEGAARAAIGSVGQFVTISKDKLIRSLDNSPRPPQKTRAFDVHGTDFIERSMNWLSTYYESAKVHAVLEDLAVKLESGVITAEEAQLQYRRAARAILSGVDGAMEIIKKHGGDEALAIKEILELSPREQQARFGGALRENERYFIQTAYKSNFHNEDVLNMLSNYNLSFIKTAVELTNNKHQIQLINKLRGMGRVVTESEWQSFPQKVKDQFVNAESVTAKPGNDSPVFTSSLRGAYISRPYAEYFSRQLGLQKSQVLAHHETARPIKLALNKFSQFTKLNLLLDVINNTVLRNALGGELVQSISHARYFIDPRFTIDTIRLIRKFEKGEITLEELPPGLVEAMKMYLSQSTSVRADFMFKKGGRLWRDIRLDASDYASRENLVKRINEVDSPNNQAAVEALSEVMALKGMDQELSTFHDNWRTQDIESPADLGGVAQVGKKIWEALGTTREKFLEIYGSYDTWKKTAYHWFLTEKKKFTGPAAFKEANSTYIDYGDLSPALNFLRFGGGHVGYGMFVNEFVGFGANAAVNHWNTITTKPIRTAIMGWLGEANDRAMEETLRMALTVHDLRNLYRDPTVQLSLWRPSPEFTTGLERGNLMDMVGGVPFVWSGAVNTGPPSTLPGVIDVPLLGVDPKAMRFNTPMNIENFVADDFSNVTQNFLRMGRGAWNNVANSAPLQPSKKKRDIIRGRKLRSQLSGGYIPEQDVEATEKIVSGFERKYESGYFEESLGAGGAAFYKRVMPRFWQSAMQAISAAIEKPVMGERKGRAATKAALFGISGKPFNPNDFLDSDVVPEAKLKELRATLADYKDLIDQGLGTAAIRDGALKVDKELKQLERTAKRSKEALRRAQLEAIADIRLAVIAKLIETGYHNDDITIEQVEEILRQSLLQME
tara:strand:+ start:2994 stop:12116 length:9123 start_codon:yes stop_codon:yes gene_type:complete